jgi:hypothetical protein
MRREAAELDGEVAVGDGVEAVAGDPAEAELLGDDSRSMGKVVPASAPAPRGRH